MSFMNGLSNGLSSMGAGIAAFAGTAGLEQQKADLLTKQTVLADQLATTRESAGRQEAGAIAATAAEKEHGFLSTQGDLQRQSQQTIAGIGASATLGAAGISASASKYAADAHARSSENIANISAAASKYATDMQSNNVYATIAAAEPEKAARILQEKQQTALAAVQTQNAADLRDVHKALATEAGKDAPDPTKIASLKSQVTSLEVSAGTEAATTSAAAAMYRTDMDNVTHFNAQLVTATAGLNNPEMSDPDRAAQKGLVAELRTQLAGAQRALDYSSSLVHGRVGEATGNPPPGVAPPPPDGVPAGARYSPSMKIWQAPDGSLFDARGKPTSLPQGAPAATSPGLINSGDSANRRGAP